MSIESWKAEFYPVTAEELLQQRRTDLTLVQHSLKKWSGTLSVHRNRHDLPDISSCPVGIDHDALCLKYPDQCANKRKKSCPIVRYNEEKSKAQKPGELPINSTCIFEYIETLLQPETNPTTNPMIDLLWHVEWWLKTGEFKE